MRNTLHKWSLGIALSAVVGLAGCGSPASLTTARVTESAQLEALAVPPQSAFKTFSVVVTKVLPEDNSGLTHQNFVVKAISPDAGGIYEVNNSTTHGSEVPNLKVGVKLTIRGTVYTGRKQGIHWTHKANKAGDAGWIKTEDGKVYE